MLFYSTYGNAHPAGNILVRKFLRSAEQENFPALFRQCFYRCGNAVGKLFQLYRRHVAIRILVVSRHFQVVFPHRLRTVFVQDPKLERLV